MPGGSLDKYVSSGDTTEGGAHKYTFSGFGDENTPYWRKKAEREAAEREESETE